MVTELPSAAVVIVAPDTAGAQTCAIVFPVVIRNTGWSADERLDIFVLEYASKENTEELPEDIVSEKFDFDTVYTVFVPLVVAALIGALVIFVQNETADTFSTAYPGSSGNTNEDDSVPSG
jgi:hypothetical protein